METLTEIYRRTEAEQRLYEEAAVDCIAREFSKLFYEPDKRKFEGNRVTVGLTLEFLKNVVLEVNYLPHSVDLSDRFFRSRSLLQDFRFRLHRFFTERGEDLETIVIDNNPLSIYEGSELSVTVEIAAQTEE